METLISSSQALLLDSEGELERYKVLLQQKERDNVDYKKVFETLQVTKKTRLKEVLLLIDMAAL